MKIRIKFAKYGVMKFIGHLDVMRFFQKAVSRAQIDIRYSEGFNPHQVMSFAAPLGVGIESAGEYMDIEVNSMESPQAVKDALNRTMVEGIDIVSVIRLPDHAKNAMASVAAARYRITYKSPEGQITAFPIDTMDAKLAAFYDQPQIPILKKTKKGESVFDLKPGIYEICLEQAEDLFAENPKQKPAFPAISMLVDASSSGNVKPALVLEAFCKFCGVELTPFSCQITRVETYTSLAKEDGERQLVPLDAVGM